MSVSSAIATKLLPTDAVIGPMTLPRPVICMSWFAIASNAKTRLPEVPLASGSPVQRKTKRVRVGEKLGNVQSPKGFAVVYWTTGGRLPAFVGATKI